MADHRARIARCACAVVWLTALTASVLLCATISDPAQLLGAGAGLYLGAWGVVFMISSAERSALCGRFLACSVSILLTVAPFEAAAIFGAIDFRAFFANPTPAWQRPENAPDPELLFVRRGNQRLVRSFLGDETHRLRGVQSPTVYHSTLHYDGDGFRNPEHPEAAGVIVIGDSFIEGAHVADREVVTAQLGEALAEPVRNLGRIGYGPQQELEVLRRHGVTSHPRVCVWAFYEGNDLDDADRYESDREELRRLLRRRASGTRFERSFVRNALLYAIRTWLSPEPRWPARGYTGRFVDRSGKPVPIYFASGDYRAGEGHEPPQAGSPRIDRLRAVISEMNAVCRRAGTRLVVVFIPTKWRVYRDLCTFEPGAICSRWPVDGLPRVLGAVARSAGDDVSFLDLTGPFVDEATRGTLVYLADDTHWSAEGHRAAARAIAGFLESRTLASRGR